MKIKIEYHMRYNILTLTHHKAGNFLIINKKLFFYVTVFLLFRNIAGNFPAYCIHFFVLIK